MPLQLRKHWPTILGTILAVLLPGGFVVGGAALAFQTIRKVRDRHGKR